MSNELNLDNVGDRYLQAEALIDVIYTMEQARGVSFTHVLALESAIPGLVMDSYPEGGFTPHVSQKNAELVYTAVNNWLASNGITVERHATESWGSAGKILAGVGIFAAVIALIKWIMGLFGKGGGKGGGGDITAPANKPTQVMSEMDKVLAGAVDEFEKQLKVKSEEIKERAKKQKEEEAAYVKAKAATEKEWHATQDAMKAEKLYEGARTEYRDGLAKVLNVLVSSVKELKQATEVVLRETNTVPRDYICTDIEKDFKRALAVQIEKSIQEDAISACKWTSKCLTEPDYKASAVRIRDFISAIAGVIAGGELKKVTATLSIIANGDMLASNPETMKHLKEQMTKLPSKETISAINGLSLDRYADDELVSKREEILVRLPSVWPFFKEISDDLEKIMGEKVLQSINVDLAQVDKGLANALKETEDSNLRDEITLVKDNLTTGLRLGVRLCNQIRQMAQESIDLNNKACALRSNHKLLSASGSNETITEFTAKFKDIASPDAADILNTARKLTDIIMPPASSSAMDKFLNSDTPFTC